MGLRISVPILDILLAGIRRVGGVSGAAGGTRWIGISLFPILALCGLNGLIDATVLTAILYAFFGWELWHRSPRARS